MDAPATSLGRIKVQVAAADADGVQVAVDPNPIPGLHEVLKTGCLAPSNLRTRAPVVVDHGGESERGGVGAGKNWWPQT